MSSAETPPPLDCTTVEGREMTLDSSNMYQVKQVAAISFTGGAVLRSGTVFAGLSQVLMLVQLLVLVRFQTLIQVLVCRESANLQQERCRY